jgi:hypothetical protein
MVSAGTTRLAISYRYDRAEGANVIDLGLFEPGPLALGSTAFRGWSGGERTTVFVGADEATPGYWPGPLTPGRWHILLGLYKISPAGVDVEMRIETSTDPVSNRGRSLATRPSEPVRRGPNCRSYHDARRRPARDAAVCAVNLLADDESLFRAGLVSRSGGRQMTEQLVRDLDTQRLDVHVPEHAQLKLTRLVMASFDAHDNFGVLRTATAQHGPDDANGR